MAGSVGASGGSRAASCAFMGRLDLLTTAVYPHEALEDYESGGGGKDAPPPPRFVLSSPANVIPVMVGMARLTFHILRPYVVIGLLFMAGLGSLLGVWGSAYCLAAAAALVAHLFLLDGRFGRIGSISSLPPGLHYSRSSRAEAIVAMVPALRHPHYKGTPWIIGGDMATLYPFLAFRLPAISYTRRWLTVDADDTRTRPRCAGGGAGGENSSRSSTGGGSIGGGSIGDDEIGGGGGGSSSSLDSSDSLDGFLDCGGVSRDRDDKEAVALDLALPEAGLDPTKPFFLVLHGLTGGSAEAYVLDFVSHAIERGCGVCVMITRGCMGTPVRGQNIFHGARISDARSTVKALRQSLPEGTPLAMVGYSMGAIIAKNYAAIAGADSGVSCCVSMSGSFDTRTNMESKHSQRVWQPILAMGLKENFVLKNTPKIAARGVDLATIERCSNVLEIDTHLVSPYNGYPGVTDYYADMSAAAGGKIAGLRTPTLAVSALDDPIMTADGAPIAEVKDIQGLFILLTRRGGHVGWPTGWWPSRNKWSWMSTTSLDFCEAVIATAAL